MRKKPIFCDFMNGTLFHGQRRLKPEMLSYLPESNVLKLEGKYGKTVRLDQVRDAIFLAEMPGNHRAVFRIILGEEGQSHIDYGMAIRDMGYDAGAYLSQLRDRQRKRREEKNWKDGNEFLSGIKKGDKFIPVISLCFYYGESEWDAGTSLFELLDIPEGEEWIYGYLSDYKLNLVHAGNVEPENFQTGLRQVFQLLPFSGDAIELRNYMEEHKAEFSNVPEETCELLLTFFDDGNMELMKVKDQFYNSDGGGYNMCTAFKQMREEGIRIGEARGEKRGEARGEARGEDRVNRLIQMMIRDGRSDEIGRMASDRVYQRQLFQEYSI